MKPLPFGIAMRAAARKGKACGLGRRAGASDRYAYTLSTTRRATSAMRLRCVIASRRRAW